MKRIGHFLKYCLKESINYVNYITAFLVGLTINLLQSGEPFYSVVPFFVPIVVQVFSKASVHYRNRGREMLLLLPGERDDPAFLINEAGDVITSTGKTKDLFNTEGIKNIKDLLLIDDSFKDGGTSESFSPVTGKWYSLKAISSEDMYLVWLDDITDSINMDLKIGMQRKLSSDLMSSLDELIYLGDIYERLAKIILAEGYYGVFLTKTIPGEMSEGHAYKLHKGVFEKSRPIKVDPDSPAPVNLSRRENRVVLDSIDKYGDREMFDRTYPFCSEIQDFMIDRIFNFISFHKGDMTIIAFNKEDGISSFDQRSMESAVENARLISTLLDMARANDSRFLESMEGLCAAAEFSDEITGKHIYRVNEFSSLIAREFGLDEKTCIWLGQVAAIHDIGKVAMPEIIKINRMYSQEERNKMQTHTVIGAEIIEKMISGRDFIDKRFLLARKIALYHHQEWSGQGYPGLIDEKGEHVKLGSTDPGFYAALRPLKGEEIPVEALIVSLADHYDALRSPRHYKVGFSHEKAVSIIEKDDRSGRTGEEIFGPHIMEVFRKIHEKMEVIYDNMSD